MSVHNYKSLCCTGSRPGNHQDVYGKGDVLDPVPDITGFCTEWDIISNELFYKINNRSFNYSFKCEYALNDIITNSMLPTF